MKIKFLFLLIFLFLNIAVYSQKIPIYVTPFYNSMPLQVNVGKYSNEIKKLNKLNYEKIISKIKDDIDNIEIEALYVLSIRLYDIGEKYEALYWFYNAQMRARVFMDNLDPDFIGTIGSKPFELKQAFIAFNQLAGEYINGHAYGDIDKAVIVLQRIIDDNQKIYNPLNVYPDIKFLPEDNFIKTQNEYIEGCKEMIEYVIENKEEIYRTRKENGIEGLY